MKCYDYNVQMTKTNRFHKKQQGGKPRVEMNAELWSTKNWWDFDLIIDFHFKNPKSDSQIEHSKIVIPK